MRQTATQMARNVSRLRQMGHVRRRNFPPDRAKSLQKRRDVSEFSRHSTDLLQRNRIAGRCANFERNRRIRPRSRRRNCRRFARFNRRIVRGSANLRSLFKSPTNSAEAGGKVLYVSGEESERQIKMRGERLGFNAENLFLLPETNLENILDGN